LILLDLRVYFLTFGTPMDGQNQNFLDQQLLEEASSVFPVDNYIEEVDPVDLIVEDNQIDQTQRAIKI